MKRGLGIDVVEGARRRIREIFESFDLVLVGFSGGKDSGVLLNLAIEVAGDMGRLPLDVVHIDLEAWFQGIVDHVSETLARQEVVPHWLCLPIPISTGVSQTVSSWTPWDPEHPEVWSRPMPEGAVSGPPWPAWFRPGMDFYSVADAFALDLAKGRSCARLVGLRADESLNRFRAVANPGGRKTNLWGGRSWTTVRPNGVVDVYPIYDWRSEDVWTAHARFGWSYCRIYDLMRLAGVPLRDMRLCQPFGNAQRRGLWMYPLFEPETWARISNRVPGANFGLRHVREDGSVMGNGAIELPPGFTWRTWAEHLLASMPPEESARQRARLDRYLSRCAEPSWMRVCRVLLKNDHGWGWFPPSASKERKARRKALADKFGSL